MNKVSLRHALFACCALWMGAAGAASSFDTELAGIQKDWAVANYQITDNGSRKQAFEALTERAHRFSQQNPNRAEPLIWEGIVLSTYAGAKGGLGALSLAKKSRTVLEQALKINADALDGSAYTSLGALYSKVPGFPIGFGDDGKARAMLQKALALNPDGIDANYFYAQYLCDHDKCREAARYLQKAAQAAPRPGRELADEGRRREIAELMAKAQ